MWSAVCEHFIAINRPVTIIFRTSQYFFSGRKLLLEQSFMQLNFKISRVPVIYNRDYNWNKLTESKMRIIMSLIPWTFFVDDVAGVICRDVRARVAGQLSTYNLGRVITAPYPGRRVSTPTASRNSICRTPVVAIVISVRFFERSFQLLNVKSWFKAH